MKFYNGRSSPPRTKNGIFIAEHGSGNRNKKSGYDSLFISVDPDGKNRRETVFAAPGSTTEDHRPRPDYHLKAPEAPCGRDDKARAAYIGSVTEGRR